MGKIVFDTSTIISISDKCLINLLKDLAKKDGAKFLMAESVYREAVEKPIKVKRFELNAVRIKAGVDDGWLKIVKRTKEIKALTDELSKAGNTIYSIEGKPMRLMHEGEIETIAIRRLLGADLAAIDERTTRMVLEDPHRLHNYLEYRQETQVSLSEKSLARFRELAGNVNVIRSVELIALAYERGYFEADLENSKKALEAALFAAKYAGCAVSTDEIHEFLGRRKID